MLNVLRYGGHLFVTKRTTGTGEIPKIRFSVYIEKYTGNTKKFDKTLSIELKIILNPPYNPIGSAFDRYCKPTVDLRDL